MASVDETIKTLLIPHGKPVRVEGGAVIIAEGDEDDDAFYVVKGRVKVVHINRDGRVTHLADFSTGELFGYFACLQRGARTATVIADGDVELLRIAGSAARHEINEHPDLKDNLMIAMTQSVIETQHRLIRNAGSSAEERILAHLKELAVKGIVQTPHGWKTEQAEVLSLSRENFSRHLSDLQKRGVIEMEKDSIRLA